MEDVNDILFGDNIVRAISFNRVISVTASVLFDSENLIDKIALKKTIKTRTGARETHELFWRKD